MGKDDCAGVSEHISDDIRQDNAGSCELDVQLALDTDKQHHHHGQNGEKQLVFNTRETTYKSHRSMQQSEDMYKPTYLNIFHNVT